ncbi:MAG: carboxylesterase family protein [Myxococcales bacterium]
MGRIDAETRLFLAIPYAEPPLGERRLRPPVAAAPWQGTRTATEYGPSCPQPVGAVKGALSEDCLTLNVFAPLSPPPGGAPVMVFLHGGGFGTGGAAGYPSQWLSAPTGTLIVTLNYRLGALGFLVHPAIDQALDVPSGNMGLRDQQLALAWVRDNIAAFGGDPARVTVFGESAGALSSCLHMFMKGSEGLARGFIAESGSCVAGSLRPTTREKALDVGAAFVDQHCALAADTLQCLQELPVESFVSTSFVVAAGGTGTNTWPHVDGELIAAHPMQMLRARHFQGSAFIAGSNAREAALYELYGFPHVGSHLDLLALLYAFYPDAWSEIYEHYKHKDGGDAHEIFIRIFTDEQFRCPTRAWVREASALGVRPYLFSFAVAPAAHSLELDYVFGWPTGGVSLSFPGEAPNPPTPSVVHTVQTYWTTFARTLDPNDGTQPTWPSYDADNDSHMILTDPTITGTALSSDDCDFWDQHYAQEL